MFNLEESWKNILNEEFKKPYFTSLLHFLDEEYNSYKIFPPKEKVFEAFNSTPFDKIKVVVIGQDPYHNDNQSHGLCFSVNDGVSFPPSLSNIFKELQSDLQVPIPTSGNLSNWAKQGVLLLNATLTVRAHSAGSHQKKGWEQFTDTVIQKISQHQKNIVFLLWGGFAKSKIKLIDETTHFVLVSGHPSPLSANRGHWFGNQHFSKTNKILNQIGKKEIEW